MNIITYFKYKYKLEEYIQEIDNIAIDRGDESILKLKGIVKKLRATDLAIKIDNGVELYVWDMSGLKNFILVRYSEGDNIDVIEYFSHDLRLTTLRVQKGVVYKDKQMMFRYPNYFNLGSAKMDELYHRLETPYLEVNGAIYKKFELKNTLGVTIKNLAQSPSIKKGDEVFTDAECGYIYPSKNSGGDVSGAYSGVEIDIKKYMGLSNPDSHVYEIVSKIKDTDLVKVGDRFVLDKGNIRLVKVL